MDKIPDSVFYTIGALILLNLGALGSVAFAAFKTIWFFSKMDSRVDDAKSMAIRAHKRLDKLEADK